MQQNSELTSPAFRTVFGGRFNCDLIDVDDVHELIGMSEVVITELLRNGVRREDLVRMLQLVLDQWGPEVVEEFEYITDVAWSDTPKLQEKLRAIVSNMLRSTSAHYYTPPGV